MGHEVIVEDGAGREAGFTEKAYRDVGAEVTKEKASALKNSYYCSAADDCHLPPESRVDFYISEFKAMSGKRTQEIKKVFNRFLSGKERVRRIAEEIRNRRGENILSTYYLGLIQKTEQENPDNDFNFLIFKTLGFKKYDPNFDYAKYLLELVSDRSPIIDELYKIKRLLQDKTKTSKQKQEAFYDLTGSGSYLKKGLYHISHDVSRVFYEISRQGGNVQEGALMNLLKVDSSCPEKAKAFPLKVRIGFSDEFRADIEIETKMLETMVLGDPENGLPPLQIKCKKDDSPSVKMEKPIYDWKTNEITLLYDTSYSFYFFGHRDIIKKWVFAQSGEDIYKVLRKAK